MSNTKEIIIPRPGAEPQSPHPPIPGPSEDSFTSTFGTLLPPAEYLETPNGKVAYYTYSASPSTTTRKSRVLFLHGVQTPSLGLQPLASTLHTSFPGSEFVLLDLYGHGLSSTPMLPHEPCLFISLIDCLLHHLNWSSYHLIGYSFGGITALNFITSSSSSSRASKIKSISLIAPAGLWKSSAFSPTILESSNYKEVQTHVLDLLEGGPLIIPQDWALRIRNKEIVAEKIREWQMQHHPGHTASVVSIFRDGGIMGMDETYVKAISTKIPIIAILGENDDVVTEKDLMEIGMERIFVIEGTGHAVVREKVNEVARYIGEFWEGFRQGVD